MRLPKPNNIITEKYVVGMSVFKNRLAKIKLSANESALGPSPKAKKEYIKVSKSFARYPDTNGTFLRETLSKKFKLDKNRIVLGSGSDQIFELICKAYLKKGDEVIVPKYLSLIHISEPTRQEAISYAVFCLKKKKTKKKKKKK